MQAWQSNTTLVDGIELQIHASDEGVTLGKLVDGVYASDLLLTPDQARALAVALIDGADHAEGKA
jgi:hypothetical protein